MGLADVIRMARGDEPADLVLRNAQLVNVFSGEIEATDIAIGDSGDIEQSVLEDAEDYGVTVLPPRP